MTKAFRMLFLVLLLLAPCLPAVAAENSGAPEVFEARRLWLAFQDNRTGAEARLLETTVTVSGIVVDTGMSIYLTPNVKLSDAPGSGAYIVCVLPRSDTGLLSGFAKGDRVTMSGKVYRANPDGGSIVLKQCARVTR